MEKKPKNPRKEPKVAQPLARSIEPSKTNADGHRRWRADWSRSRRSFSESQSDFSRLSIRIRTVRAVLFFRWPIATQVSHAVAQPAANHNHNHKKNIAIMKNMWQSMTRPGAYGKRCSGHPNQLT
jgi:hypothetical protein